MNVQPSASTSAIKLQSSRDGISNKQIYGFVKEAFCRCNSCPSDPPEADLTGYIILSHLTNLKPNCNMQISDRVPPVELLLQFLDDEHGQRCCQNLRRFAGSGWAEGHRRRKYCGSVAGHRVTVDCRQGISAPQNSVGHLRSSLCRRSASRVLRAG